MALQVLQGQQGDPLLKSSISDLSKRESTAIIMNPPKTYIHTSPPKRQNIVQFDCRGLEFIEFKSDVCFRQPTRMHAIDCLLGRMDGERVGITDKVHWH